MGRTIPSWRTVIEETFKRWRRFQETLRADEREIFEDLMNDCRRYASAAGASVFPIKVEGIFLAIIFAHHKKLRELEDKVDRLIRLTDGNDRYG
ncbi:hypothetical protein KEJ51_06570 [Candidatus Bathyarchaeota archaeon]|nr:hypothetical protein [Candidatus Bathyarchaeota archaeon]